MQKKIVLRKGNKRLFIVAILILLGLAFYQGLKTTHELHWAYDVDFDRDMSFVQGNLDGNIGRDPNYKGEYIWYNPLVSTVETILVKVTGLPIHIIVTKAGAYLNMLSPIAFVIMLIVMFDYEIALCGLLSYLFLASGNLKGYGAATYTPWLYPVCFVQFLFYMNMTFLYKALVTQRFLWYFLLGIFTGICFLGHLAPSILIVGAIMMAIGANFYQAFREKNNLRMRKIFLQSLTVIIPFLILSFPLLYIFIGKYHLHYLNRSPVELTGDFYQPRYFGGLFRINFSISLLIALLGYWRFYRHYRKLINRRLILGTFWICIALFLYSSFIILTYAHFHIRLPATVPSFHYFFYLKAFQSIFFAFGLVYLFSKPMLWAGEKIKSWLPDRTALEREQVILIFVILLMAFIYFPFYKERKDFSELRQLAFVKASQKEDIDFYYYAVSHISSEKVILCEKPTSIFPVMATGRKMVSISSTFSNPFVDFEKREKDRNEMISYLENLSPEPAPDLFTKYQVEYVLLPVQYAGINKNRMRFNLIKEYVNDKYVVFSLKYKTVNE